VAGTTKPVEEMKMDDRGNVHGLNPFLFQITQSIGSEYPF
jgi:hypothetical protein